MNMLNFIMGLVASFEALLLNMLSVSPFFTAIIQSIINFLTVLAEAFPIPLI